MLGRHMKGCVYSNACPRAGGWSIFTILINAGCLVFHEDTNTRQEFSYNAWALFPMCLCPDTIWKMPQASFSSFAAVCVQAPPVYWGCGPEPEVPRLAYHVQDHAVSSQGYPSAQVSGESLQWNVTRIWTSRLVSRARPAFHHLQYIKAVDGLEYFITWMITWVM